jgi:hypothetical protein
MSASVIEDDASNCRGKYRNRAEKSNGPLVVSKRSIWAAGSNLFGRLCIARDTRAAEGTAPAVIAPPLAAMP